MDGGAVLGVGNDGGGAVGGVDEHDPPVPVDESRSDECLVVEPHGVGLHLRRGRNDVADVAAGGVTDDEPGGDAEADGYEVEPRDLATVG